MSCVTRNVDDVLVDSYNQFDNFTNKRSISAAGNAEYHTATENVENGENGPSAIAPRAMSKVTPNSEGPGDEGRSSSSDGADTSVTPGTVTLLSFAEQTESGDTANWKDIQDSPEIGGGAGKWES
jgi:hypothetical protein